MLLSLIDPFPMHMCKFMVPVSVLLIPILSSLCSIHDNIPYAYEGVSNPFETPIQCSEGAVNIAWLIPAIVVFIYDAEAVRKPQGMLRITHKKPQLRTTHSTNMQLSTKDVNVIPPNTPFHEDEDAFRLQIL